MDKRRIRPLWLIEAPDHSGMAIANLHLAVGMGRVGMVPALFALRDGDNAADFVAADCHPRIFPHLGWPLIGGSAAREALETGVSLVHAISLDLDRRGERLARKLRVPLVATANRLEEDEIRLAADFRGQLLVAVSDAIRERLVNKAGVSRDRIRVIRNCLDLSRFPKPSFPEVVPNSGPQAAVIGTFGRLAEKKGQRVFLQTAKLLIENGLDAEFLVLGDGPDRSALRNLADELNISKRITFTPKTVSGQLARLDILVEPSLQEGLGMSVMQAMAMGVPVVASGVGGLYDLIDDGVTGIMVQANDPEALARAILGLLDNPGQRLELARQAREKIEREFSCELVAQELSACYREVLDSFAGWGGGDAGTVHAFRS
ncbi:MAG: glycosyltransferase family 4 protein [Planctomycetota bacterium]|jgi:glycosyltransferase involved in cell wall biosynthesis|nr:glycosyltransferase family 4 protein [Planctomycetota bacterium]